MSKNRWCPIVLSLGVMVACSPEGENGGSSSSSTGAGSSSSSSSGSVSPATSESIKISEAVAKSGLDFYLEGNDWIEFLNTGSSAVNLNEYSIRDAESELIQLPSKIVSPGEYVIVQATDEPPLDGGDYVPFQLGKEDSLTLVFNGSDVDTIAWVDGDAKQGRSYGRINGQAMTLYPTPEYDNAPYVLFDLNSVRKVTIDVEDGGWDATMANPRAEQYYRADFNLNGAMIKEVGFRTKGQGSLNTVAATSSHRHGFKVHFEEYVDQKFMGVKKLVFNNSFSDPSLMRDFIAYKTMKEAGVPAPETSFVDLWVEDEHLGVYLMVEAIDTEFVEKYFPDDKENDLEGDLFKGELFTTLQWVDNQPSSYSSLEQKTNKSVIGTEEEGVSLIRFLDSINNAGSIEHIDTDIMVRYLAASAFNGNMDSHIGPTANNFYLYDHMSIDRFTLLPWDYNLGFGLWGDYNSGMQKFSFGGGGGFDFGDFDFGDFDFSDLAPPADGGAAVPVEEPVLTGCLVIDHVIEHPVNDNIDPRPMIDAMLADAAVMTEYRSQLLTLIDGAFNPDYLEAEIMRVADMIDPYVKNDPTMFFTYDEWRSSLTQDMPADSDNSGARGASIYGPAPGLIPYIKQRVDIIRQQLNGSLPANNSGDGSACPDA